ncbi:MAG: hypothetical protein U0Q16_07065 [Bryobacteraceae bacterium]
MKLFRFLLAAAMMVTFAFAGDVSGKWKYSMAGRNGNTVENTLTLKADGDKLTGTVSGRMGDTAIQDGKVSGDEVSFNVVRNFNGNEMKIAYKGKLEGDSLKLNIAMGERNVEATAKRAQ